MLAFAGSQQPAVRDAARIVRAEGRLGTLYGVAAHYIADQARIRDVEQLQAPHRLLQHLVLPEAHRRRRAPVLARHPLRRHAARGHRS